MFIQAITMVFVLDSPKKWIETAFTESVSTRRLPWIAENTFADRRDQMFIRLINKVYKDTNRLSVQNTFTNANCTIVFKLSFRMFYIIYFITLKGFFFFTFISVFGSELILYFLHMTGERVSQGRAWHCPLVTLNCTSSRILKARSIVQWIKYGASSHSERHRRKIIFRISQILNTSGQCPLNKSTNRIDWLYLPHGYWIELQIPHLSTFWTTLNNINK